MEIVSSVWHAISALLVLLLGVCLAFKTSKHFGIGRRRAFILYAWHTLFAIVYLCYVLAFGGDAIDYFRSAEDFFWEFNLGSQFIIFLTALMVNSLHISLVGVFLIYNIFGSVGLIALDASLQRAVQGKSKHLHLLATIIVFLPSVSFWSSGIGKDSLSFMATGLALWAALALNLRWKYMVFSIVIMLLVRPHMACLMLLGWMFAIITTGKYRLGLRIFLLGIVISSVAIIVPFALQYTGIGEASDIEAFSGYVEQRQAYNMEGGGGIDIASMSLPMQLFTYMFRPLIFESISIFALVAAVDNLILLYLFFLGGRAILCSCSSNMGESRAYMWSYSLLAWLLMAMTTANMGIALRQKWMFAPMLVYLMLSVIGAKKKDDIV